VSDTPFWKKEISLRRKPAPEEGPALSPLQGELDEIKRAAEGVAVPGAPLEAEPEPIVSPEPQSEAAPPDPKTPFWKKEISFRRTPKPPVQPAPLPPAAEEAPTAEATANAKPKKARLPKLEARPRVKRDRSGRPLAQRHKKLVGRSCSSSRAQSSPPGSSSAASCASRTRSRRR
jgi:hypothetical protein